MLKVSVRIINITWKFHTICDKIDGLVAGHSKTLWYDWVEIIYPDELSGTRDAVAANMMRQGGARSVMGHLLKMEKDLA